MSLGLGLGVKGIWMGLALGLSLVMGPLVMRATRVTARGRLEAR